MLSIDHVAQKYRSLHLTAIASDLEPLLSQAQSNEVSYLHLAESLIDQELKKRNSKRIEQNRRKADFPVQKSLEEFDYKFQTTINKREINNLLDFNFI